MLRMALALEPVLREAGIDPEEVEAMELNLDGHLTVKLKPKVQTIEIVITKKRLEMK